MMMPSEMPPSPKLAPDRLNGPRTRAPFVASIPPGYRPRRHLVCSALFAIGGPAVALSMLGRVQPLEWLVLPGGLIATNFVEYVGHRWALHRQVRFLDYAYHAHTLRHHVCFPQNDMYIAAPRELGLVMFGWKEVLIALAVGAPFVLALSLISANAAALMAAALPLHYLLYELCHLVSHLPADHFLARRQLFASFRLRHALHHGRANTNLNVSLPICDWLFGTLRNK